MLRDRLSPGHHRPEQPSRTTLGSVASTARLRTIDDPVTETETRPGERVTESGSRRYDSPLAEGTWRSKEEGELASSSTDDGTAAAGNGVVGEGVMRSACCPRRESYNDDGDHTQEETIVQATTGGRRNVAGGRRLESYVPEEGGGEVGVNDNEFQAGVDCKKSEGTLTSADLSDDYGCGSEEMSTAEQHVLSPEATVDEATPRKEGSTAYRSIGDDGTLGGSLAHSESLDRATAKELDELSSEGSELTLGRPNMTSVRWTYSRGLLQTRTTPLALTEAVVGGVDLSIPHLSLGDTYIGLVSGVLKALPSVTRLNLRDNRLTDAGIREIVKAIGSSSDHRGVQVPVVASDDPPLFPPSVGSVLLPRNRRAAPLMADVPENMRRCAWLEKTDNRKKD